jgi:hypothetical protein
MSREFNLNNPIKGIPRPRVPADPPVEPFKNEEIELLIKACHFCQDIVTDPAASSSRSGPRAKAIKPVCSHDWLPD